MDTINQKYGEGTVRFIERKVTDRNPKPVKDAAGIIRKLNAGDKINQILDVMGMTIITKDAATLNEVTEMLRGRDDVLRVRDRYNHPDPTGYRDILTNVRLPSGMVGEVQVNTEQMLEAKQGNGGHNLYNVMRELPQGDPEFFVLKDISKEFYGRAYDMVLAEEAASDNASLREITWLRNAISSNSQGEGSSVLSAKTVKYLLPKLANAWSSKSKNSSRESSNAGTSTAGTREAEAATTASSFTSVPSASTIDQNQQNVNGTVDNSGVPAIREKYQGAQKTYGYEDTKNVGGEELEGRWVLVEAETPTASHDETTFNETPGFPSANGATINDRDYRHDQAAQDAVIKMAADYDSRALEGVVITDDGIVISGNNRTMSGKRAAREGSDGKYSAALEKKARKYGFTAEQVREYQHPRLVFEIAANGEYTTELFAQFNQSTRKAQSPLETAIKMTKRLAEKPEVIREIAAAINEHEALTELYNDPKAVQELFDTLQEKGLIGEYDRPQYVDEKGSITRNGEDFLESVLLGSVLEESNIRGLSNVPAMRQKLVRGITALVENKAMGEYSFIPEMNEAAGIALAVNNTVGKDGKRIYGTVRDYVQQQILPGMPSGLSVEKRASIQLAEALESGGQKDFALWYGGLNASLAAAAKGQSELFTGGVESKEDILDRYVGYREDLEERKKENRKTLTDTAAGPAAKAEAALDDAGIAKTETLFQIIGERGAEALDQAEETTIRLDNLDVARRMEAAAKDAKAVRLATGWERGADGKWRYEIVDIETTDEFNDLDEGKTIKLSRAVKDGELLKAYPQLNDISVTIIGKKTGNTAGSWNRETKTIELSTYIPAYDENGKITFNSEAIDNAFREVLIHEIQHTIQEIEGFAGGGNINLFTQQEGKRSILDDIDKARQKAFNEIPEDLKEAARKVNRGEDTDGSALALIQGNPESKAAWADYIRALADAAEIAGMSDEEFYGLTPAEQYHRLAGEVEARNAQARMGFTPRQRLETLLAETEDVSREDQLFLTEGAQIGAAMSMGEAEEGKTAEVVDIDPSVITDESGNAIDLKNTRELMAWIRKQYQGKEVTISDDGLHLTLTRWGLESSAKKRGEKHHQAYAGLERLIENALYDSYEEGDTAHPHIEKQNIYYAATRIDGALYSVRLKIDIPKDKSNPNYYKDHKITEIEIAPSLYQGSSVTGPSLQDQGATKISLAVLKGSVKPSRIEGTTLFQTYEEFLTDAARYESAEEFEAAYRKAETRPDDAYISTEADHAWYVKFWQDARLAAGMGGEQNPGAPEQGDRAFLKDINRENLRDILITLDEAVHARRDEPVEPAAGEDRTAYGQERIAYRQAQDLQARVNRELPHLGAWVGIAARVANGEELSKKDYNTLRGYMRKTPRDYRALFAYLADKPEWGLNLTEIKNGRPETPLAAPRLEQPDDMDEQNRRRLAALIGDADPELARGIGYGDITVDDPRIQAFEKGLEEGIKRADKAISAAEAELAEDARKFKGTVQGRALELYGEFKEAEEKYQARSTELAEKIRQGEALTGRYQEENQWLLTDFDAARTAFEDFAAANTLRAEVREELARIDGRYAERKRLKDLRKKRNAIREVKRIERNLIKRIVRKISLKTVAHDEAVAITVIQSFFEPSLIAGVNHRLGTVEGPALRELYEKWKTDADFREELQRTAQNRAVNIADILGKPKWEYITNQEKRTLIRLLPKKNWIAELKLEALEQYREDLVPLDIKISGEGQAVLGPAEDRIAREALGEELYSRIRNQPLEAWTMLELSELAEVVDDLYVEGREDLRAKNEARYIQYENYRNKLSDLLRITKYQINPGDSPEERKRKQGEIAKILGKYAVGDPGTAAAKLARGSWLERTFGGAYFDANVRRVARILDNGKNGTFTNLLYWQENDAYNLRERAKMARNLAVQASMRELGIKMPELFQQITVKDLWGSGVDQVYTVEELLGMKLASRDELSRRAVIYGNLANETERSIIRDTGDLSLLESLADTATGRYAKVMAAADTFFSQEGNDKYLKFMEVVARDYDGVYDRLNRANIDVFNEPVWKVEHYFPMFRLEQTGGVNEHQEINDLLGLAGASTQWADKGMTQTRIKIGPEHQTAIELGLYTTWAKSLDRVEHFIAYAPYVRTLNMVFKSRDGKALMQRLQDRYGAGMGNYIKEYINEKANPTAESNRHASDNIVKAMRGRTASAYLAWKTSGVLKQLATSPWPYLQYMNPLEYSNACIQFYQNPKAMTEFIKEKSIFMATRTFDPVVNLIREQQKLNESKVLGKIDQFNNLGMKGLEMIDWTCVAPGWLAVYNREMARLQKANNGLGAGQQLSRADMEYEAAAAADDIVRLTQPSGRDTDQAPMFKNTPQAMKAFLQFTQSLNVIWQNIRYDMPAAVREGQILQLVGGITGYILAGVSLGLLAGELGGEDDEEKDAVAWQRKLLYYSFTQFTDAVPFIGDAATKAWELAATGRMQWSGGNNLFPVVNEAGGALGQAIRTGQKLGEDDGEAAGKAALKGLLHFEAALEYSLGIPYSGRKELLRAIGIGDGDGELGFNPGAFAGRR